MPDVPIPFPLGGLNENASFTEQLPMTSSDCLNVRGIDPITGRIRGGQRGGLERLISTAIAGTGEKAYRLITTSVADSKVDYSEIFTDTPSSPDAGTPEYSIVLPSKQICRNVVVDLQSNVYALDGNASWVKYNSEGKVIYKQACPVEDSEHIIRALAVDDLGGVYLGVSAGGNQRQAKIFKFQEQFNPNVTKQEDDPCAPQQEPKVELIWTIAPNEFVEDLVVFQGALYAIQNDYNRRQGWLASYTDIFTQIPAENFRRRSFYPSNGIDIREDGTVFVSGGGDTGALTAVNGFRPGTEHWNPLDNLPQYEDRIWAWYDASQLEGLQNGDVVFELPDLSGNGRDLLLADGVAAADSPRYDAKAFGNRPGIHFPGAADQILQSLENAQAVSPSSQKTTLPAYANAGFAIFVVFRSDKTGSAATDRMTLLYQPNTASASDYIALGVNQTDGGAGTYPGTASADDVWLRDHSTNELLATNATADGTNNDGKACIVSYVHDRTGSHNLVDTSGSAINAAVHYNADERDTDANATSWETSGAGGVFTLGCRINAGTPVSAEAFVGHVAEIIVLRDYVDSSTDTSAIISNGDLNSEWKKIDAYLAWKWGCHTFLNADSPYVDATPHPDDRDDEVVLAGLNGGTYGRESYLVYGTFAALGSVAKFAPSTAELIWTPTEDLNLGLGYGGLGYGVKIGCDGNVFTCGKSNPLAASATQAAAVRRVIDNGETFEISTTAATPNGAWGSALYSNAGGLPADTDSLDYQWARMDVDKFGNLYVPIYDVTLADGGGSSGKQATVYIYQQDINGTAADNNPIFEIVLPDTQQGTAVAVDRDIPSYRTSAPFTSSGNGLAEFIYIATDNVQLVGDRGSDGVWADTNLRLTAASNPWSSYTWLKGDEIEIFGDSDAGNDVVAGIYRVEEKIGSGTIDLLTDIGDDGTVTIDYSEIRQYDPTIETLHRLKLVDSARDASAGSPRTQVFLGVAKNAGGTGLDIKKANISGNSWDSITGGEGGADALDATTDYVDATVAFQKIYFTDGLSYKVWSVNPDTGAESIVTWKSKSGGKIPPRARLMTTWRGRIVLARFADDPNVWAMSAIGDPDDWDFFPPTPTATQAVLASLTRAGNMPDSINAVVSYNDDLLFFGGDRSIWRLTGDPQSGGQLDLVTDVTGMTFGRCWTKDPQGALYFFGSRGGVYAMAPGGPPQRISLNRIERRLQNIDLGANYVELVWNYDDEGLQVLVFPFEKDPTSNGSSVREMYFWEKKTDSWWPDQFGRSGVTNYQPTAAVVLDSDAPSDRVMVFGCEDGIVRKWSRTAKDDDLSPIDSYVLIGPMSISKTGQELHSSMFTAVLASNQDGCRYEYYLSDEPDNMGPPWVAGNLLPGRNDSVSARARGAYLWLKLRNALADSRWAAEHFSAHLDVAGPVRARARR